MAAIEMTTSVNAPLQQTFDVFSDLRSAEQNVSGIKRLEILNDAGAPRRNQQGREVVEQSP